MTPLRVLIGCTLVIHLFPSFCSAAPFLLPLEKKNCTAHCSGLWDFIEMLQKRKKEKNKQKKNGYTVFRETLDHIYENQFYVKLFCDSVAK